MKETIKKHWFGIVIGIIFMLFVIYTNQRGVVIRQTIIDNTQNQIALADTVRMYENRYNESVSVITAFQSQKAEDILLLFSRDSTIRQLQRRISDYERDNRELRNLVLFYTETIASIGTETVVIRDTVLQQDEYHFYFADEWIRVNGMSRPDTTVFDLAVYNQYSVATLPQGKGFQIEVTNHSPYTTTPIIRGWNQSFPPQKKWGFGPTVGYGYNFGGNKLGIYLGLSINYNIINW
jgi:hypothetical protein